MAFLSILSSIICYFYSILCLSRADSRVEAFGLESALRVALSPFSRDLGLLVGPLRVSQFFDTALTQEGEKKMKPIGNLISSAAYKAVLVADFEPFLSSPSARVVQTLAIAKFDDATDLGKINGSLCYLEDVHVVQTDKDDGVYLMGKYVLFKSSSEKLGEFEVATIKPKNRGVIGWFSAGSDPYVNQLNQLYEKTKQKTILVLISISSSDILLSEISSLRNWPTSSPTFAHLLSAT